MSDVERIHSITRVGFDHPHPVVREAPKPGEDPRRQRRGEADIVELTGDEANEAPEAEQPDLEPVEPHQLDIAV
jgi:hypothetical protein